MNVLDQTGGSYWAYKSATDVMVRWVKSTFRSLSSSGASSGGDVSLARLTSMVRAIVDKQTELSTGALDSLRWALAACKRAVRQRQRVSQLFSDAGSLSDEARDSNIRHAHCIATLQDWHSSLAPLLVRHKTNLRASLDDHDLPLFTRNPFNSLDQSNSDTNQFDQSDAHQFDTHQFDTHQSDTNQFDTNQFDTDDDEMSSISNKYLYRPKTPRRQSAKAAPTGDEEALLVDVETEIRFKLGCLILDVEELMEKVVQVWTEVKAGRASCLAGAAVSTMAIRCVAALEADVVGDYAALESFEAILHCIRRVFSDKRFLDSSEAPANSRQSTLHFLWLTWRIIGGFAQVVPRQNTTALILREGKFGPPYEEEQHPLHETCLDMQRLLLCELAKMYNFHTDEDGIPFELFASNGLRSAALFLSSFAELLRGRSPSLRCVFATAVWMRAVQLLQGQRCLGQTVGVAKIQLWELNRRLTDSLVSGELRAIDPLVEQPVLDQCKLTARTLLADQLYRYNPVVSGSLLLDVSLLNLRVGAHIVCYRYAAVHSALQLYNAVERLQLVVRPLPLLDQLRAVLAPLFPAAAFGQSPGAFLRSALAPVVSPPSFVDDVDDMAGQLSALYRVFRAGELDCLPGASTAAQLDCVVQLLHDEQARRGVIGFDFVYAFRLLGEFMASLSEALFAGAPPHLSCDFLVLLLLNYLDTAGSQSLLARQLAALFDQLADFDAEALFSLPRAVSLTQAMFGGFVASTELWRRDVESLDVPRRFSELLDMFEEAGGPLSGDQAAQLRADVLQHPVLLFLFDPTSPLPGIVHHLAAGRAAEPCLLEWCVALGGAACVDADAVSTPLHCAVAANNEVSVRILLGALSRRHLSLPDAAGDTPLHLATRNHNAALIKLLLLAGPDLTARNKRRLTCIDLARTDEIRNMLCAALQLQLSDEAHLSVLDQPDQCHKRQKQMQQLSAKVARRTLSRVGLAEQQQVCKPKQRKPSSQKRSSKRR